MFKQGGGGWWYEYGAILSRSPRNRINDVYVHGTAIFPIRPPIKRGNRVRRASDFLFLFSLFFFLIPTQTPSPRGR